MSEKKFLTGCDFAGLAYAIFYITCLSEHADGSTWINETRNAAWNALERNLYRSVL